VGCVICQVCEGIGLVGGIFSGCVGGARAVVGL
jgi:hypothetical protein